MVDGIITQIVEHQWKRSMNKFEWMCSKIFILPHNIVVGRYYAGFAMSCYLSVHLSVWRRIHVHSITSTIIISFLYGEGVLHMILVIVLIEYMHNDLISDLDLFHIPEAIFKARAFRCDWYKCSN